MYPPQAPWTGIGALQSDISSIKSELRGKADDYKISSLNSDVATVASSIRELSSVVDGLLDRVQTCEDRIQQLEETKVGNELS